MKLKIGCRRWFLSIVFINLCFSSPLFAKSINYSNIVEPVNVVATVVSLSPLKLKVISLPYKGEIISLDLKKKDKFKKNQLVRCRISSEGVKCTEFGVKR
ncbi:hypothetical protein [Desulfurobacterium sp.]